MKIVLGLALVFAFTSGFPKRQEVAITSLFKEWRGLIDELPVEDVLRDAAHNEVNDLFTRITAKEERGLFTDCVFAHIVLVQLDQINDTCRVCW